MANGKQSFNYMLKQQAQRALPTLDTLNKQQVKTISRTSLLNNTGLSDTEIQKLIHDGNLPHHTSKMNGIKIYEVEPSLKMLARYCNRYEYVVD